MAVLLRWANRWAPWLLAVSSLLSVLTASSTDPIDLHIYVAGGAGLDDPARLYEAAYVDPAHGTALPYVYPPFAAVLLHPLHLLPFGLVALGWRIGVVIALYACIRISQHLIGRGDKRAAMLWTAGVLWLEPIVGNVKHGTIGVFLMLAVIYAAYSSRWWVSGLLVGIAAGVKLTPAISGLYFVGERRWRAAIFSAVVFVGTLGVGWLLTGDRVRYFFTEWIGRDQLFPIAFAYNQSWRAGIARVLGYDPGDGAPLVIAVIAATAVVAAWAWWSLRTADGDRLGRLLVVMMFGLLASPVSWTNHWVWLVPLMVWLLHGPWSDRRGARVLWWLWLAATLLAVPNALATLQQDWLEISRPWFLAWAAMVYPALTLATFGWIIAAGRAVTRDQIRWNQTSAAAV
ncbi:mannosyltransferase [Mycobacterium sp. CBMA293]|uniref:mannosyltransferase n=1 Tax=unclassified Mycolicibacterium TaxID=2636767 RepID=UPI0012DF5AC7|nr:MULTISPECIES: mannosyltransferase [unclassified Mycolicibacterium]MUL46644.1 mannosyltransferase [Mycolicibacterium sp. CBMA 360]MUL59055.1 mannosyltransferase [Mycolicibacterium sp. CBMA 335]MUL69449.1 mannosyltransferase [Mycolicibacterium sp. CBMA 311]MUL94413.1 mannosyltransferase [Mycolicibacterium sp. CBMA 230]MUM06570.1 hypothetical protein [Mycolicibacterium sp. CBMA 213]